MTNDPAAKYKRILARSELRAAGCRLDRIDRAVRLLDLDAVDAEDGEVTGLAEEIAVVKRDFGELFEAAGKAEAQADDEDPGDEDQGHEEERSEASLPGSVREAAALLRSAGDSKGAQRIVERHTRRPGALTATQVQAAHLLGRGGELPPEAA
jgi:hypothetical protein